MGLSAVRFYVGSGAYEVLCRHAFTGSPEARLITAVLGQAIRDTVKVNTRRSGASYYNTQYFFASKHFEYLCELVDLEPDFVRGLCNDAMKHKIGVRYE